MQEKMNSSETFAARPATRIELENGVCFSISEANLPLLIGRDSSCGIRIPSGHVSRQHCEIFLDNGELMLRDMSSNGTTVDNRLIKQDVVSISGRTSVYLADEVKMTLTPIDPDSTILPPKAPGRSPAPAPRPEPEPEKRAGSERRTGEDRRKRNIVVSFDRRSGATDRRLLERRNPDDPSESS